MWRRASVLLLLLLLLVPALAEAHPGHGPEVVEVRDPPNRYEPGTVTIGVGDSVVWQWTGTVRNHSVTAHDGAFDSDPGESPSQISHPANDQFTHVFTQEGTYGYHCKVHSDMGGKVIVVNVAGVDVEPPRLSDVRVSRAGSRYRVHFRLSEQGDVLARVRKGDRTVRSFDLAGHAGRNRGRIRTTGLAAGRYRIVVTAFDAADNRSAPRGARFRVR